MKNIRFGTNIITFFEPTYWGLPETATYADWTEAFDLRGRDFFEKMFDGAAKAGLEGVELAPNPADWEAAIRTFGGAKELREALEARGLVMTSSYSPGSLIADAMSSEIAGAETEDHFRRHAAFIAEMGASTLLTGNIPRSRFGYGEPDNTATAEDFERPVSSDTHERFADQLNRLGAIAREFDVAIAIHTDAYSVCSRNEDIATVLSLTDPQTVMLCPDAGHITLDGGDPVAVLRDHLDRVRAMHWKDCVGHLSGHGLRGDGHERHGMMLKWFRILGSGIVDWEEWMRILRDNNWRGWAIEEIDMSPEPVEELIQGLRFFRENLAPLYN